MEKTYHNLHESGKGMYQEKFSDCYFRVCSFAEKGYIHVTLVVLTQGQQLPLTRKRNVLSGNSEYPKFRIR